MMMIRNGCMNVCKCCADSVLVILMYSCSNSLSWNVSLVLLHFHAVINPIHRVILHFNAVVNPINRVRLHFYPVVNPIYKVILHFNTIVNPIHRVILHFSNLMKRVNMQRSISGCNSINWILLQLYCVSMPSY